ncbi:MAG: hypothetical protein F4X56_02900 [Gammaproteobacteria bacterium]|nr:hypothetical protein [Gammaproteobacteria bacterium]MYC24850.1 hypothetical protein [Gammaproteobacteria bacterium]
MFVHGITDFLAALVFVVSYFLLFDQNIYWAAGLFMITLAVQFCFLRLTFNMKISPFMWFALIAGAATTIIAIVFQSPIAIEWRPTVISWVFGGVCLTALLLGRDVVQKWILKYWMIVLTGRLWMYQILTCVIIFFLGGVVNLAVAYTFSEQIWVLYLMIAGILWAQLGSLLVRFIVSIEHRRIGEAILFDENDIDSGAGELPSTL